eukprot:TRINITY_DN19228_c0_g1_i3.p1 TRINITY_DN19228_c0_g1~~TRINITY_DN19228_c0_g1_i3.p1  ORF type:complete len:391 (+),score=81.32 TRINITY_DN19228_c0_g1_i3:48-1220(+)
MTRRPPRSTLSSSSAASDVYKRQDLASIAGTGPKGIVLKGDVLVAAGISAPSAASAPASAPAGSAPSTNYPSHEVLGMPALSPTMTTGNVGAWKVKQGDQVSAGDVLCEVETDKATVDFENQEDGYIAAILVPEGASDVPVGQVLAILVEDPADIPAFANYTQEAPAPQVAATPVAATPAAPVAAPVAQAVAPAASSAVDAPTEEPPLYYLTVDCEINKAIDFCEGVGEGASWSAMALKASCAAMRAVPAANSAWMGPAATRQWHQVHMECRAKDGSHSLIQDAGAQGVNALNNGLLDGAPVSFAPTFTVNFAGDLSFARQRVGAGQSVVLTISEPSTKLVPSDCEAGIKQVMFVTATLSCDHRTVDGALGAVWLKHFRAALEDPVVMLL